MQMQHLSIPGASMSPTSTATTAYLSEALLLDALHRKDVLAGGRQLHSRISPIAVEWVGGERWRIPLCACRSVPCALATVFPVFFPPNSDCVSLRSCLTLRAHKHIHSAAAASSSFRAAASTRSVTSGGGGGDLAERLGGPS